MRRLRAARGVIIDWLRDRLLGSILTRIDALEANMSALSDFLTQYVDAANAQTTRISNTLAELKARLDSGDATAAAEVSAALSPLMATLSAMGTGSDADPLPAAQSAPSGDNTVAATS